MLMIDNRNDVKAIFDPLITDIERLVDDQVNLVTVKRMHEKHPKANEIKVSSLFRLSLPQTPFHIEQSLTSSQAIFLVGGFGANEYLKSRLKENHPKIQIIQPHDAWCAIAK